nr:type I restriction endonuclease subunit R [Ktedonobacteraceae bacterium]
MQQHDAFDRDLLQQQLLQRAADQFSSMKYTFLDAGGEQNSPLSITRRKHESEVVLRDTLWAALRRLNPDKPEQLLNQAFNELTRDLSLLGGIGANKQVHQWLKNGYKPAQHAERKTDNQEQDQDKRPDSSRVSIINWSESEAEKNEFLLVQNFYVSSELGRMRLDLVGFVNGLPLILPLCRLTNLYDLYHGYLAEYKRILPRLFWYNACILLSNGPMSKLGSLTASWKFFFEWKRLSNKQYDVVTPPDELDTSLERMLSEVCAPKRLLDLVENFILYSDEQGGTIKLIARNHQYLGVNAVFDRVGRHEELKGKLGVFWHTQGSGKSYSMVFLKQKVQRLLPGGWTFVIVTDREDLDTQIYQTFQRAGVVPKGKEAVHARDSEHLRRMLQQENHEVVFTLIQKFRTEKPGQQYPTLSTRDNIIVIADEAHRTQYDTFAQNMLDGLPNASFLGFTGTPLIQQEREPTRVRFGDYVSVYNFSDAIRDGITVPLFYENHTPEMVLNNPEFVEAVQRLIDDNVLDDERERRLSTRLLREYSILTNAERLDWIAENIVAHFLGRGYLGKAMVVSVDKPTVVRMYDKVQNIWLQELARLQDLRLEESNPHKQIELDHKITYMLETDMAVIISGVAPDDKRFDRYGLDPAPHIQRMEHEDLETAFKRQDNLCLLADSGQKALRIVFVCGMWITGFDVPCLSTIYLDRPMQGHTLMQAIARANRVYDREKIVGMIIDYVGSFNDLLKALAIYATSDAATTAQDVQIGDKSELISQLESALHETDQFCTRHTINIPYALQALSAADTADERRTLILDIADRLLGSDDSKIGFLALASEV